MSKLFFDHFARRSNELAVKLIGLADKVDILAS